MEFKEKKRRGSFIATSCALAVFLSTLASAVAADEVRATPPAVLPTSGEIRELEEASHPDTAEVVAAFSSAFEHQDKKVFINSLAYDKTVIVREGVAYAEPVEFFSHFSNFESSGDERSVIIAGEGFDFSALADEKYVTANGRCFYCPGGVVFEDGRLFVPIEAMAKAFSLDCREEQEEVSLSGECEPVLCAGEFYVDDDLYWLSRIISCESMSESFEGKIAVGNVVLNRVCSAEFPPDVKGVVFDSRYGIIQFSPVRGGYIYNDPDPESVAAAKVCLEGVSLSDSILYFMNPALASTSWISDNREAVMTIGHHTFYS